MKKYLAIFAVLFSLAGCATTAPTKVEPSVVVQYKYVTLPLPDGALAIPANVEPINLSTATQKDVADWLARSEGRTRDLEEKLRTIKSIQEKQKSGDK